MHGNRHYTGIVFAFLIQTFEIIHAAVVEFFRFMMLHDHHRNIVQLDGIGNGHQRSVFGSDLERLIIHREIRNVFDAGFLQVIRRVERFGQPGPHPATRRFAGKFLDGIHRCLDIGLLVFDQVSGALVIGMPEKFPPGIMRRLGETRILGAHRPVQGKGRRDTAGRQRFMETPEADPHTVFLPRPIRDIRNMNLTTGRRQNGPRHRLLNIPVFDIHDHPDRDPLTVRQLQRFAVCHG